jgi:transcriptional regulator with XRE-family HTH domain
METIEKVMHSGLSREVVERFSSNLRIVRAARGTSANDLSKKLNLKAAKRISDLEYPGRGVPSLDEVMKICKELEVPIDHMLNKKVVVTFTFQ